jgi:hypothetical protein
MTHIKGLASGIHEYQVADLLLSTIIKPFSIKINLEYVDVNI